MSSLISVQFAIFTLLAVGIYYAINQRWQNGFLLAASYTLMMFWHVEFALILLSYSLLVYWLGFQVLKNRLWLILGVSVSLGLLIFFGIMQFYIPQLRESLLRLGLRTDAAALRILVPIGLSYYTLQGISYLVDVRKELLPPSRNPINFMLYLAYFPKLVAGPIERAHAFLPLLEQKRTLDNDLLQTSIYLIIIGLVRKLLIADSLNQLLPPGIFSTPQAYNAVELITAIMAYGFALYNDFAGYTSLVRGISGFFGIPLSVNFYYPYFAGSFSDFLEALAH